MDDTEAAALGKRIVAERERLGLSQVALAEAAGVAPNTVLSIEAGKSALPRSVARVRAALGMDADGATDGVPAEVTLAQDIVREWMLGMPQEQWPGALMDLMRAMSQSKTSHSDTNPAQEGLR